MGLFRDEYGPSYTYDSNGNVIGVKDQAQQSSTFQYEGNNNLVKNINPRGGSFTYEYDSVRKNRLLKAINDTGETYSFEYDQYGNTTKVTIAGAEKAGNIVSGQTYYMKSVSNDKYFDIEKGNTATGANLEQWDLSYGNSQKFTFYDVGEGYFKIVPNHATDKVIYYNPSNGNQMGQKTWSNGDDQKWKPIENTDGTYRIISKANPEYCITVKDDSQENGGKIVTEKWQGKQNQHIMLYNPEEPNFIENNEVYYLKEKDSNLYMEMQSDTNGSGVVLNKYSPGNKNQLWRIVKNQNNIYKLIPIGSINGKGLNVKGTVNNANQMTEMWDYLGSVSQQWKLEKTANGTYRIMTNMEGTARGLTRYNNTLTEGTSICIYEIGNEFYLEKANMLDIEDGATYKIKSKNSNLYVGVNGTNVEQQASNNLLTQHWVIEDLHNGYYRFHIKSNTSNVMNVVNSGTGNGTNIEINGGALSTSQQFEIIPIGDGRFRIATRITNGRSCLEIAGSSMVNGGNLHQWANWNNVAQEFYLEKIESAVDNKYIETSAEYSSNGNYLTKTIDQEENETQYQYNTNTGTVTQVTDAKGNSTNYEYDNLDRLTKVSKQAGGQTYQNEYTYENDKIKSIIHNGTNYYFEYDTFGNTKQTKVGNQVLGTNNYGERNGLLNSFTYGNGQIISYNYDRFNRLIKKTGTNGNVEYTYDAKGNVSTVKDNVNGNTETYTYDLAERVVKKENTNGSKVEYFYDNNSNVNKVKYTLGTNSKEINYNYDKDNRINSIVTESDILITNYDRLSRVVNKELIGNNNNYVTEYTYLDTSTVNKTTEKVKSIKNGNNNEISYTYDANGNIETVKEGTEEKQRYYYDELNQLIREDNKTLNKTIVYTYDLGGNILTQKEYAYTVANLSGTSPTKTINYTYGNTNWKDQLTSYNGKAITYDEIGNPLTYDGWAYTWQNGRELASITKGNTTIQCKYNDSGIRTSKTVNGAETKYYLDGNKVIYETRQKTNELQKIYYTYDENGCIIGLEYENNKYYFIKNLQNDIIGILNSNLEQIVKYEYDSWGNVISITDANGNNITDENNIGLINEYRYRSYRYDSDTGLYYLQSRYYNPEWGRFINADVTLNSGNDLLGHNLYTYCNNNPINFKDKIGNFPIGIAISFASSMLANILTAVMATVVTAGVVALTASIVKTEEKAKEVAKEKIEEEMTVRDTTVYKLIDEAGKVQYVGRTKDPVARKNAHRRNPARAHLKFKEVPGKYTKIEARGLEQLLIEKYSTLNRENRMNNQINGIRWNNPDYGRFIWAAQLAFPESETFVGP